MSTLTIFPLFDIVGGIAHQLQHSHASASIGIVAGSAASALISAVWEGTVVVALVALCLRLFPGLSATARSAVWVNVFVALLILGVLPSVIPARGDAGVGTGAPPFQFGISWGLAIAVIWFALSVLRGSQVMLSAIRLRKMARRGRPIEHTETLQPLLSVRTAIGIHRSAELCSSSEVERPSVFGFFRPRILVPPALLARLTEEELSQVVMHEMEHLRRADDWTNLFQKLALVVFPLNPALFWVERKLCAERELACDDRVLRSNCGRKAYAVCLTHLAEHSMLRKSLSLALGAWERQSELARRVHRILRKPVASLGRMQTAALTGGLIVAIIAGALTLGRAPQLVGFVTTPAAGEDFYADAVSLAPHSQDGFAPRAQLAKAMMSEGSAAVSTVNAVARMPETPRHAAAVANRAASVRPHPRPARRPAAQPDIVNPEKAQQVQPSLLVLTQWTEAGPSTRLVFTTTTIQRGNRTTYAAIPTIDGWLLIEI